jgi:uncharacterized ion transporter superfamily protein YfcC
MMKEDGKRKEDSIESPFFGALALALCTIIVILLRGIDAIFNDGIERTILHWCIYIITLLSMAYMVNTRGRAS